ncbi:hypothetical protein [Streptomyces halstedii]|uniref:Uncharacterized protein n=1 Tax=Streptomyces halstedii TaxID=1944 RepID=A0A6N9UDI4_STRHA|nr:hypothetical protein [Streptomyces halstedii]NEA20196.1 hypothetical protein [Streptomyces halstedii]
MYRCERSVLVERAAVIVAGYKPVGGCTLRQVYYRLVAEAVIPHTAPAYGVCPRVWPAPAAGRTPLTVRTGPGPPAA